MTPEERLRKFAFYAEEARRSAADVERRSNTIRDYAAKIARSLGANGRSAVVSQQLAKDIPFLDLVGDRNRDIQLAIMYGTLALLHKDPPS